MLRNIILYSCRQTTTRQNTARQTDRSLSSYSSLISTNWL